MNGSIIETDRRTLYLLSNGDILPWSNQEMYEYAWEQGIRPLDERRLKPGVPRRKGSGHLDTRMDTMIDIQRECCA
ncbi:MAG TPA: hypothetical protein PKJ15_03760 [Methanomassiliicoccales archaeon]|nr:hypothetical protein [Methanomassiliicoccales archaeon]